MGKGMGYRVAKYVIKSSGTESFGPVAKTPDAHEDSNEASPMQVGRRLAQSATRLP